MDVIEITVQSEWEKIRKALVYYLIFVHKQWLVYTGPVCVSIGLVIYAALNGLTERWLSLIFISIIISVCLFYMYHLGPLRSYERYYAIAVPVRYVLDDKGVHSISREIQAIHQWTFIKALYDIPGYYILQDRLGGIRIIPKTAFITIEDAERCKHEMAQRIKTHKKYGK